MKEDRKGKQNRQKVEEESIEKLIQGDDSENYKKETSRD